ncbi:MAG: TetR/AcrR family transcriptional regulator [Sphingomonadales bacterium]|nr:MAG: TetR/AcrR family transcriptional regulator [Sphingomonadales bacterium]
MNPPSLDASLATDDAAPAPAPKRRRTYLPAAERRRQIIEAAQQVFSRTNLQGARTRDIAKAADVNQATLFEHFASKEALFIEAVVQPLLEAMDGMRERTRTYEAAGSWDQALEKAHASSRRHLESIIALYPLLVSALFSDPALGTKLYRGHIAPLLKQRGEAIAPLTKDGISPEFVRLATFGIYFAIAMDQAFGGKGDVPALAEQATNFALFGFAKEMK